MERLGGLDGAFLYCETPTMHLHVCGLLILDPSTIPSGYSFDRFRSVLAQRLTTIRAVHQRLATAPLHLGRPFWTDDPRLDLDHHLQHLVLDPPGDDRILADAVGAIAGRQLRRDIPLWEISVIEGLAGGRIAVLLKMHHSIIDGVSAANIMGHLLDLEPAPAPEILFQEPPTSTEGLEPAWHSSAVAWRIGSPSRWSSPDSYPSRHFVWSRPFAL